MREEMPLWKLKKVSDLLRGWSDLETQPTCGNLWHVKQAKKRRRDVVSPFREKLWEHFRELACGMDGAEVVEALKQAGEEIWAAGIDDAYSSMSSVAQDDEMLGNAFDIAWITVVCIKLKEMKQGKKPKVRIKP